MSKPVGGMPATDDEIREKYLERAIRELNRRDRLTVFLVEQNAFHALKLAHRGYVIVNGLITLSGSGRELLERPEVRAAYLEGEYGYNGLFVGVPVRLGASGIEKIYEVQLTAEEKTMLDKSAGAVKELVDTIKAKTA